MNKEEIISQLALTSDLEHPLVNSNVHKVLSLLKQCKGDLISIKYGKGQEVVDSGIISGDLQTKDSYNYAFVPLGIILDGELTVIKGSKGTKRLAKGDFIGLFETSDWLLTERKRQIGDWTLIANKDTEILFFSSSNLLSFDAEEFRNYLVELSRKDPVPQPITNLPLLDWVASHTTESRLPDTLIIAHTHILPNNLPFFRHLAHLVGFGRIFVLEKPYSTVRDSFNELARSGVEIIPVRMESEFPYEFAAQKSLEVLWRKVHEEIKSQGIKKLLIVDDGGDIWTSVPWNLLSNVEVAGVEQTQRGITRIKNRDFEIPPIVSVATSGIKKLVESEFIGRSVVKKLSDLGELDQVDRIGIIGMGSIGSSVLETLKEYEKDAIFYDSSCHTSDISDSRSVQSMDALLNESDLIIGTTGTDALKGIALERVKGHKKLASASSSDVEFASILKLASPTSDPFGIIEATIHENLSFQVLNGGYPINFDRKGNATPDKDIVLTRCLLYIGVMQAMKLLQDESPQSGIYNLDPVAQLRLLSRWIQEKSKSEEISINEEDVESIVSYNPLEKGLNIETVWRDRKEN